MIRTHSGVNALLFSTLGLVMLAICGCVPPSESTDSTVTPPPISTTTDFAPSQTLTDPPFDSTTTY